MQVMIINVSVTCFRDNKSLTSGREHSRAPHPSNASYRLTEKHLKMPRNAPFMGGRNLLKNVIKILWLFSFINIIETFHNSTSLMYIISQALTLQVTYAHVHTLITSSCDGFILCKQLYISLYITLPPQNDQRLRVPWLKVPKCLKRS